MAKKINYEEIIEKKWIVEFNRKPFDKQILFGFLLDFNDDFTLIQKLDQDWYQLDGYCVFQNKSVRKFRVHDKEEYFLNEVIKVKKLKPKAVPNILLDNWATILQTVNDNFTLVGVESELFYKDSINIGKIAKMGKKSFSLKEISPNADWDDKPYKYKFKHLTLVKFGNDYNDTLWKVSENRKKLESNLNK